MGYGYARPTGYSERGEKGKRMSQGHSARIADRYDALVTTDADIAFFVELAEHTNGPILELMVGTGRVTLPLVASGAEVVAVDYSAEMLARLREKTSLAGFQADIRLMDIRHLVLDQTFNLILIPFHAFPVITDPLDQQQTLRAIRMHLAPGGRFVCTLHNPPSDGEPLMVNFGSRDAIRTSSATSSCGSRSTTGATM